MSRYDADDVYCYAGTNVLRNRAGITNAKELDIYEGEFSTLRTLEIQEKPIVGQFDLAHLQRIHLTLFQDVYDWARKLRTVDISRGNSRFAHHFRIRIARIRSHHLVWRACSHCHS